MSAVEGHQRTGRLFRSRRWSWWLLWVLFSLVRAVVIFCLSAREFSVSLVGPVVPYCRKRRSMRLWTVRSIVFWLDESVGPGSGSTIRPLTGSRTFLGLGDIVCWLEGLDAIHLDLKWPRRNQPDSPNVPAEADNSQKLMFGLNLHAFFRFISPLSIMYVNFVIRTN